MSCLSCGRGFHDECDSYSSDTTKCCCSTDNSTVDTESTEEVKENHRRGDNVSISAGRKRAAAEYEIDSTAPCEWRGRANCGGGFTPVVGCIVGFQIDRHHGPDKNTTSNERENIHLICKPCHNLWHRRNDPLYGEEKCPAGIEMHSPRWATEQELLTRESV